MSENIIKDWLSAELQKVHSVVVYINPTVSGVKAPADLCSKPSFTLQLSNHFDRPLVLGENGFKSDFLFEDGFQSCIIPWTAIWAAHPENEADKIVFWNQNSPGAGWDQALVDYLGSQAQQSKDPQQVDSEPRYSKSSPKKKTSSKPQLSAVATPSSRAESSDLRKPALIKEKASEAEVEDSKSNSSAEKSAKLSRSHLKLVK